MSFGTNLYELRKQKGLSQEQLALEIGVSRQTIYAWESETASPSIENLKSLSSFFSCTTDYLISGNKEELSQENNEEKEEIKRTCRADKKEVDRRLKIHALLIALPTMLIISSVAVLLLMVERPIIGTVIILSSVVISVPFYVIAGTMYNSFFSQEENKYFQVLYSEEEKKRGDMRNSIAVAISVSFMLIGVILVVVLSTINTVPSSTWYISTFLFMIAISVFCLIFSGIMHSRFRTSDETYMDQKSVKLNGTINSIIWMLAICGYLVMGFVFSLWHPGWIIFVVAAFLSGIISSILGFKK
ncbi:MAG: helix-turn-helix transcriptional regulator [Bacillales bacterium]|nr:helix-turn-helix transcriptional regulator [Bacillales bacterium]